MITYNDLITELGAFEREANKLGCGAFTEALKKIKELQKQILEFSRVKAQTANATAKDLSKNLSTNNTIYSRDQICNDLTKSAENFGNISEEHIKMVAELPGQIAEFHSDLTLKNENEAREKQLAIINLQDGIKNLIKRLREYQKPFRENIVKNVASAYTGEYTAAKVNPLFVTGPHGPNAANVKAALHSGANNVFTLQQNKIPSNTSSTAQPSFPKKQKVDEKNDEKSQPPKIAVSTITSMAKVFGELNKNQAFLQKKNPDTAPVRRSPRLQEKQAKSAPTTSALNPSTPPTPTTLFRRSPRLAKQQNQNPMAPPPRRSPRLMAAQQNPNPTSASRKRGRTVLENSESDNVAKTLNFGSFSKR